MITELGEQTPSKQGFPLDKIILAKYYMTNQISPLVWIVSSPLRQFAVLTRKRLPPNTFGIYK